MPRAAALTHQKSTPERLIRAGVSLFQAQGYHGTGISAILERAAAPKGSFYHHFPGGKEELAVATLAWLQSEVCRYLDDLVAAGAGFDEMVEGLALFTARGLQRDRSRRGSLLAVLVQDAVPESAAIATAAQQFADAIRTRLVAACGGDRKRAAALADQALAMLQGVATLARIERRPQRAVEIVQSWLHAVAAKGAKR